MNPMRRSLFLLIALGVSAMPAVGRAHFLFATLDPAQKTVAVGLQENPTQDPVPLGERIPRVKAFSKSAPNLTLKSEGNWLKAPVADDCVAVALDYGVLDKRDQGRGLFWLNYFAKAAASPAASQVKLGLPVELTFSKGANGQSIVTVLEKGNPAPAADVVIEEPDGTVAFEGKTNPDGTIAIPAAKGMLAVRALVTTEKKGNHDGKAYDLVRSYCTLTVQNAGSPVAPVRPGKTFTRMLSESFGDNHDVVSHTAFVNTLMDGKLTKEQAEAHFQQRALIHQAVDKVLVAAGDKVPYGPEQKEVITLLKKDLVAMGSSWPEDAKAWDLTKKMIVDIEESAKKGPYFALGVMHVYYGGITHGGRDIGAIIGKVIKYDPTYYLKSDGYNAYAKQVNLMVTDPEAQKEMIRGGQAAYRYIIASNDDPVFKK